MKISPESWQRLEGLRLLLHHGVRSTTDLIEKHHRRVARKPFRLVASIKPLAAPVSIVETIHDGIVTFTYGSVRTIHRASESLEDWLLGLIANRRDDQ